ncbi:thioredoxin family protein [Algivirga pacifica]|uniref:Thioredoxin fold domain-containing protein n=1 Tax=Algivirga pacifica TaxID=1162670 RepID=A0ABP9D5I6_9BACT
MNYKYLLGVCIALSLLLTSYQAADSIQWTSFDKAMEQAQAEDKIVFVDVYTDWCYWCKVMDKNTFTDTEVIEYMNKYCVSVKLNAEAEETLNFRGEEYSNRAFVRSIGVRGYPSLLIISPDGKQLEVKAGAHSAEELLSLLQKYNKKYH